MSEGEMDPEARGRLRTLFDAALEQPTGARAEWIAAHAADTDERGALERLVAIDVEDAGPDVFATPAAELSAQIGLDEDEQVESLIGRKIDRFRLVRLLGQGGMAAVFLGEREDADFKQQVAIKLLRRGLYSELEQRLFRRERQALAMLSHPNIAHLLDGGVTEAGIPYLVMDYIDGLPITKYADERKLDLRARLKLFAMVCGAVDAAHRQLIVHRDLKPSNILVDAEGEAKLLDFGIAKLLDEDDGATRSGLAALTPDYAAPEQYGGGPISTATDVYALGVVLHELLVGARPEAGTTKRPSALKAELRGDLDNIILKALASEPDRRYASAGAFADDVERYLDGQPVAAHPASWRYRTRKFVRRHRAGVIATALVAVGVVAGIGAVLWQSGVAREQAARATREAERATEQAARAEAMRRALFDVFAKAEPSTPRTGPPTIVQVVEQAAAKLRTDTRTNPSVKIELVTQLGSVLHAQGQIALAKQMLQENYEQAAKLVGVDDALTLSAGHELARTQERLGEYADARRLLDRLLAGDHLDHRNRAVLLRTSARVANAQHELRRALADAQEAVRISRQLDEQALEDALAELGNAHLSMGDLASAVLTLEEQMMLASRWYGPDHVLVANAHISLSIAYRGLGDLARAESHARRALEIQRAALPKDDWHLSFALGALMKVQQAHRDFEGARRSAEEWLRIDRAAYGADHPDVAIALQSIGVYSMNLQDPTAIEPLREALRINAAHFGAEHFKTAEARVAYGKALASFGEVAGGEAELRHAIASLDEDAEPDPDMQARAVETLARVKLDNDDPGAAMPLIERIELVVSRIKNRLDPYWDGRAQTMRAGVLLQFGRASDAAAQLQAASSALARSRKQDPVLAVEVPLLQAQAARSLGDAAASEKALAQGLGLLSALRWPPRRLTRLAQRLREASVAPVAK